MILANLAANYQQGNYQDVIKIATFMPENYPAIYHAALFIKSLAQEKLVH